MLLCCALPLHCLSSHRAPTISCWTLCVHLQGPVHRTAAAGLCQDLWQCLPSFSWRYVRICAKGLGLQAALGMLYCSLSIIRHVNAVHTLTLFAYSSFPSLTSPLPSPHLPSHPLPFSHPLPPHIPSPLTSPPSHPLPSSTLFLFPCRHRVQVAVEVEWWASLGYHHGRQHRADTHPQTCEKAGITYPILTVVKHTKRICLQCV